MYSYSCKSDVDSLCCLYLRWFIFVLMQEVDPCDDLKDGDMRTTIQNATGPRNVLSIPKV